MPTPSSEPPFTDNVPRLVAVKVPFTTVEPALWVKLKALPPTVKVAPEPTVNDPALVKLPPVVVRDAPEASVKAPAAALLFKPARMLWFPKSSICPAPLRVMVAALVAMVVPLAPNCSVPPRV